MNSACGILSRRWLAVACAFGVAVPSVAAERMVTFGEAAKDGFRKAVALSDGGYVLGGWKDRVGTYEVGDGWVVSVDSDGVRRWDVQFEGGGASQVSALLALPGDGVLVALEEFPNANAPGQTLLFQLSAAGEIEQRVLLGGTGKDVVDAIAPAPNGGFWLAGETSSETDGGLDGWLLRLDDDYRPLVDLRFGGPEDDRFNDIHVAPDGQVTAVGRVAPSPGIDLGWVVRVSDANELVWERRIDAAARSSIRAIAAANGHFVIAGFVRNPPNQEFALWFAGLDPQGRLRWQRQLGREGQGFAFALAREEDDRFISAGALADSAGRPFDAIVVRLDASGELESIRRHGSGASEQARAVLPTARGYVLAGYATTQDRQDDGWLLLVED